MRTGWSQTPGKDGADDNLQQEQRSAGQARRGVAAAAVLALPLEICSKCLWRCAQNAAATWLLDGQGIGQEPHTSAVSSHAVCPVSAFPPWQHHAECREPGCVLQAGEAGRGKQQCPTSSCPRLISTFLNHRRGLAV